MVPTLGMLDFIPERLARTRADDTERDAYLAEVNSLSTQFGAAHETESRAHSEAVLRMAYLMNRF